MNVWEQLILLILGGYRRGFCAAIPSQPHGLGHSLKDA